ncbi:hypothetical protein F4677DRAFT_404516 [Hypoxylon crocopeplum]|nr:hypothetical protein F4677DRAFT_404516 [Hypoxylon crocopeplum]
MDGMPPIPALPPDKAKRQDQTAAQCPEGNHSCLELGPDGAEQCCRNDQYCFVDASWTPRCCALGVACGSPCPENNLFCNQTITTTTTIATSATTMGVEETTVSDACCARPCSSSSFLCQEGFGGQCCPYGARCLSGGGCTIAPTSSVSTVVPIIPPGCTASQIACSQSGCCDFGSTCTDIVSATQTSYACAANLTVVDTSGGLSEGAKVGIGVGISVGAAVVIGALTWFWISRRRAARSRREGDTLTGSGRDQRERDDLLEPYVPHGGPMSDITSPSSGIGPRPPLHQGGLAYAYIGPDAVEGPYTDRGDSITPGQGTEPRSSPRFSERGAMPANHYPENPSDIVRPVELDAPANGRVELGEKGLGVGEKTPATSGTPVKEEDQGPFELYGNHWDSPPPISADEAERRRTMAISPTPPPEEDQQERKDAHK